MTSDALSSYDAPNLGHFSGESVTLVEGVSFVVSSASGDIEHDGAQGVYFDDTRFISHWKLRLDEAPLESLGVISANPFAATFVTRGRPIDGRADSTIVVVRNRFVGNGMREEIVIRNLARETAAHTLSLEVDADFTHIFDAKEGRIRIDGERSVDVRESMLVFSYAQREITRRVSVIFPSDALLTSGLARMDIVVPPHGEWRACIEFRLDVDDEPVELRYRCGEPVEDSEPLARLRIWEQATPRVRSQFDGLNTALDQSSRDLGALRFFDPAQPDWVVIAAGAPWFMTLFGRDSLITSLMTLLVDPTIALGTLHTLARLQGTKVDARSEEEPGKILHEFRHMRTVSASAKGGSAYYGSVDATPLFVVLLGELHKWGFTDIVRELLPNADSALRWIEEFGDRDGDGFVEYIRATERGLYNQGWKDSFDGINFANGKLAEPPTALCEVQGYVYAAYLARAQIARGLGDEATAHSCTVRAEQLKAAFNERFWLEDRGYFALGLDGEKRAIDSLTSNIGHCLWSGIVEPDKARRVADHLISPEMFTGWGIRTLASSMGAYNPVSYHNGSVWPHDTALCAAGLMRYGFVSEAHTVTLGLLQAAQSFGGRLPELICGFDRGDIPSPVRYPTSCAPQAWSSAAVFELLRATLLRFDPSVQDGELRLSPSLPPQIGDLTIENLPFAGTRLTIMTDGTSTEVKGAPPGMLIVESTRSPTEF
jgi:glycogen debranching enzyme